MSRSDRRFAAADTVLIAAALTVGFVLAWWAVPALGIEDRWWAPIVTLGLMLIGGGAVAISLMRRRTRRIERLERELGEQDPR